MFFSFSKSCYMYGRYTKFLTFVISSHVDLFSKLFNGISKTEEPTTLQTLNYMQ